MNIFISNTGANVSKDNIKNLFSEFGSVTLVVNSKYIKNDKEFWWVMMTEPSDTYNAILTLNDSIYQNKKISVSKAVLTVK